MNYILFDIGGTKTRIALAHDSESFGEPRIVDTPKDFDTAIRLLKDVSYELTGGAPHSLKQ